MLMHEFHEEQMQDKTTFMSALSLSLSLSLPLLTSTRGCNYNCYIKIQPGNSEQACPFTISKRKYPHLHFSIAKNFSRNINMRITIATVSHVLWMEAGGVS